MYPRPWIAPDLVVHDLSVVGSEHPNPVSLRGDVAAEGTVLDHTSGRLEERGAEEVVPRRGNIEQADVPCVCDLRAERKVADGPVHYRDSVVTQVGQPLVTELRLRVAP